MVDGSFSDSSNVSLSKGFSGIRAVTPFAHPKAKVLPMPIAQIASKLSASCRMRVSISFTVFHFSEKSYSS